MVRGIYKNIVFISDLDDTMFEQAILIVRPQSGEKSRGEIIREAARIVDSYIARSRDLRAPTGGGRLAVRTREGSALTLLIAASAAIAVIGLVLFFVLR